MFEKRGFRVFFQEKNKDKSDLFSIHFMDFFKDCHHKSKQKQTYYEKINSYPRNSYKYCNNY